MKSIILFLRLFLWFCVRYMWQRRIRALTVVLGIALGAAVFTSVRLSIHASLASFTRSVEALAGRADMVLYRPGGRLEEVVLSELVTHPAVDGVSVVLTTYVRTPDRQEPFLLIGIDPLLDRSFREWTPKNASDQDATASWLDLIAEPFTIVVSDQLARERDWAIGRAVSLIHTLGTSDFNIVGLLENEGLGLVEGGRVAIVDIASFQEYTGTHGKVDRIDLLLSESARRLTSDRLELQLKTVLPPGVRIDKPGESRVTGQVMIRAYQFNLSILSFVALFVGMFLVYSLVELNGASRRHELAVLRSTGASARLIFFLLLSEGAFLGLLGWLLAFPVAGLLVRYMLDGISRTISTLFVRVHVDSLTLDSWEIALSFLVTLLVSVLAAFQPAMKAMHVAPSEVLSLSNQQTGPTVTTRKQAGVGLVLIASSWPLSWVPGFAGLPLAGFASMFFLFVGFALMAPLGLELLGRVAAPLLRRTVGVPAYLAGRYIRDSGSRTAVSVGALITAVALFVALVIMVHSFRGTVQLWLEQTISGDLFISGKMAEINRYKDPLDTTIIAGLKALQAPVDIVQNRRFTLKHKQFVYELDVLNMQNFLRHGKFVWLRGDPVAGQASLQRGAGVVVSEVFYHHTGLGIGDSYRAQVGTASIDLPIIGIIRDYRTSGGVVYFDHASFAQRYFDPGWSGARLFFKKKPVDPEHAMAGLRTEVLKRCGQHLNMVAGKNLRQKVMRIFDETFAVTTVLLLIALVIAVLGISTTLAVQVLERSRQLNTLFALGASFAQIRSMIFWEAGMLVLAGELAGLLCGFMFSYILIYVINIQSFGWSFIYAVNWKSLALSLPLIIGMAIPATLPAIHLILSRPPATLLRER